MKPRDFCHQSLEVLSLAGAGGGPHERAPLETLLAYFANEDITPDAFEMQLLLLADTDICACYSRLAERVLELWRQEHSGARVSALSMRCN